MTAPAWMPFYIADYLGDTGHLSNREHGAYLLLIMHYWQHEGLPTEDSALARICRLTTKEWLEIKGTIAGLFGPDWYHKRVESELATASETISKRIAAGKAGASARYGNRNAIATANAEQSHRPSPSPSPSEEEKTNGGARAPTEFVFTGKVGRLTAKNLADWRKAYDPPDIMAELQAADDYYADHPPKDGKWFFAFSNWLKREHDRRLNERSPPEGVVKVGL